MTPESHPPVIERTQGPAAATAPAVRLLALFRERSGLDVVWWSSFRHDGLTLEALDGASSPASGEVGGPAAVDAVFGRRVLDGDLPRLVNDTSRLELLDGLVRADGGRIGALLGVPVRDHAGAVAGMLCGLAAVPRPGLGEADVRLAERLGGAIAELYGAGAGEDERTRRVRARVGTVLRGNFLTTAFQPIVSLGTGNIVGAEALARFPAEPQRPDEWFADAWSVGLGVSLELAVARNALDLLEHLPADVYVSINASPALLEVPEFAGLIRDAVSERVVVELTESAVIGDHERLLGSIERLRESGARIAIDNIGARIASFQHIHRLDPDIVKLDRTIVSEIDVDPARRGLAHGITRVSHDTGAVVIASGVESAGELDAVHALGIDAAQGYHLARPDALPLPHADAMPRPKPRPKPVGGARPVQEDTLATLSRGWSAAVDAEEAIRHVLDAVLARTGLETSYLSVRDHDAGTIEHRCVRNTGELRFTEGRVVPWDESLSGRCREVGLRWTENVPAELGGCPLAEEHGVRTFVTIPVVRPDGTEYGTLCAASSRAFYIGEAVLSEVALMADLLATRV